MPFRNSDGTWSANNGAGPFATRPEAVAAEGGAQTTFTGEVPNTAEATPGYTTLGNAVKVAQQAIARSQLGATGVAQSAVVGGKPLVQGYTDPKAFVQQGSATAQQGSGPGGTMTARDFAKAQQQASIAQSERSGGVLGDFQRLAAYAGSAIGNPAGTVLGGVYGKGGQQVGDAIGLVTNPIGLATDKFVRSAAGDLPNGSGLDVGKVSVAGPGNYGQTGGVGTLGAGLTAPPPELLAAGTQGFQNLTGRIDALNAAGSAYAQQGQQVANQLGRTANSYSGREAPQMVGTDQTAQQAALARAQGFNPDTSGLDPLRNFQADTSGVGALERFRADTSGVRPLQDFSAPTQGVADLRTFAAGPTGPSAAEAMLRMQADADQRAQISLARSARGGPAAVAQALRNAQAEGAATQDITRGQLSVLRATEDAQRRGESLQALTGAANAELTGSQQRVSALGQAATNLLQGSEQNRAAAEAAASARLTGSQQKLGAEQAVASGALEGSAQRANVLATEGQIAGQQRQQSIEEAKSNLDAKLQTMNLNDQQTRFFSDLAEAARKDSQNAMLDAQAKGLDAAKAAEDVQFKYAELAWNQMTTSQQLELEKYMSDQGTALQKAAIKAGDRNALIGAFGQTFLGIASLKSSVAKA